MRLSKFHLPTLKEVPADADFVLEGFVQPGEMRPEGPFGDHTGFYTAVEDYPVFHLTAMTHRKNAVYPTTIVGPPPMEDFYMGDATVRIFLPVFKMNFPEIVDMTLPPEGVFHNLVFVSIRKQYPYQAFKVMHGLWGMGQMMFSKYIVVVDEDCDVHNTSEVLFRLCDMVAGNETAEALLFLEELSAQGQDLGRLVTDLLEHLRHLMLVQHMHEVPDSLPVTDESSIRPRANRAPLAPRPRCHSSGWPRQVRAPQPRPSPRHSAGPRRALTFPLALGLVTDLFLHGAAGYAGGALGFGRGLFARGAFQLLAFGLVGNGLGVHRFRLSPAYFSTSFLRPTPGKFTVILASSPSPSRRTTVPVPYLGWSTTDSGRAPRRTGGGAGGSGFVAVDGRGKVGGAAVGR